jgi:hypothetical protein
MIDEAQRGAVLKTWEVVEGSTARRSGRSSMGSGGRECGNQANKIVEGVELALTLGSWGPPVAMAPWARVSAF